MLAFCDFPEHVRLMLLAARSRPTEPEVEQMRRLVEGPVDWLSFVEVARHHRLAPLVFEGLDRHPNLAVPPEVQEELHRDANANALEALRAAEEIRRISKCFHAAGVPFTVLKGIPLSQLLFDTPNARHVGDVDLLTADANVQQQIELLTGLGYRRLNPPGRLTPKRIASYVRYWKDLTFGNDQADLELDLHWRLFNNRFHAANRMLDRAQFDSVTVFGVPMRILSPRDQFLHIAAHGSSDAWTYLKGLADVAAFLRLFTPSELDGALIRADEVGLLAQVSAAIHLSNLWLGTEVQSPRLIGANDPLSRLMGERTSAMLLRHKFLPQRNHPSPAAWLRLEMTLVPGLRSIAEIAQRFVWRPRVWSSIDLPDTLFWVYPLLGIMLLPRPHPIPETTPQAVRN